MSVLVCTVRILVFACLCCLFVTKSLSRIPPTCSYCEVECFQWRRQDNFHLLVFVVFGWFEGQCRHTLCIVNISQESTVYRTHAVQCLVQSKLKNTKFLVRNIPYNRAFVNSPVQWSVVLSHLSSGVSIA